MAYYCYIVECSDGSYYTGWSTDPQRRERQHNRGKGARYTRQHLPVRLVYIEEQPSRQEAMKREAAIKKMPHQRKQRLIQSTSTESNPCPST